MGAKAKQDKNSKAGSDSAPVAATAASAETAESLAIRQKVAEYGKQIQSLKSEGKGKDVFMPIVKQMLALKAEYKKVTGRPFDPPKSKKKKGGKQQNSAPVAATAAAPAETDESL